MIAVGSGGGEVQGLNFRVSDSSHGDMQQHHEHGEGPTCVDSNAQAQRAALGTFRRLLVALNHLDEIQSQVGYLGGVAITNTAGQACSRSDEVCEWRSFCPQRRGLLGKAVQITPELLFFFRMEVSSRTPVPLFEARISRKRFSELRHTTVHSHSLMSRPCACCPDRFLGNAWT